MPRDVLQEPHLHRGERRGAADVGDLLLRAAVPPAVLHEGARVLGARVGGRAAADDGRVRGDVVRRGIAVRATRREARSSRSGAAFLGVGMLMLSFLDAGLQLRCRSCPGMVVLGIGVGLFYSSITTSAVTALDPSRVEPGRRHRLHVPDRGRCDRPRVEHRDRRVGRARRRAISPTASATRSRSMLRSRPSVSSWRCSSSVARWRTRSTATLRWHHRAHA